MIRKLKLTNFKCHSSLEVNFTRGLQVVRGEVETGKSSLIQAAMYVKYGARALPLSLAETVTWGQPENSLRVEMEFEHAGQVYEVVRSKAGATLTGDGLIVSGQTEVTKFFENLLQVPAQLAPRLMLASQKELSNLVANGAEGQSIGLIETLGNFGLMDQIITAIQEHLPSGNTKLLEDRIARLLEAQKPEEPDFTAAEEAVAGAQKILDTLSEDLARCKAQLDTSAYEGAVQTLDRATRLRQEISDLETTLAKAKAAADLVLPALPDLEELQAKKDAQDKQRAVQVAWGVWQSEQRALDSDSWVGSLEDLQKYRAQQQLRLSDLRATRDAAFEAKVRFKAQLITADSCTLCGKDLRNVEEVQQKNKELEAQIARTDETLVANKRLVADVESDLAVISELVTAHERITSKFTPYADYIQLRSQEQVPHRYVWVGPAPGPVDPTNYTVLLQDAKAVVKRAEAAKQLKAKGSSDAAHCEGRIGQLKQQLADLDDARAAETLETQRKLRKAEAVLAAQVSEVQRALLAAQRTADAQRGAYQAELGLWERKQQELAELRQDLARMNLHNTVIKKVREARPEVARRLWALVLGGVSHYFSKIRGRSSVVSRTAEGFEVDGKCVGALSGSTLDSLGLAVRFALLKTFLPNVRFVILDEPAAACSDSREANMLGLISSTDFDQVIMVTHSDVADAFATNFVELQ